MTDWFTEKQTPHLGLTLEVKRRLFDRTGPYQRVEVMETVEFGNLLVLDGCVMVTDRDEFVYHEMIAHPALALHPNPERVLIIGGGDGGSVREAVKHEAVKSVTLVEIDQLVIDACREFFPALTASFHHPKAQVLVADGFAHLDDHPQAYDVILVDSTDPVGPAEVLFSPAFFHKVRASLRPGGFAVFQSENPFLMGGIIRKMHQDLRPLFGQVALYLALIPTYPGGHWSFTLCADQVNPAQVLPRPLSFEDSLKYYNQGIHTAAFQLPGYLRRLLAP
ncbi:MAG: polyamine aminopropyltransferase [Deltaproteobacteria bacterium]|nr:polyamine aminopropyltransferase [Deltaproteobacteria bacterium]